MRIVSLEDFLNLPSGTIYSEYEPAVCTGLYRKGESLDGDFFCSSLIAECLNGDHPTVDGVQSRWGRFAFSAQFVVYDQEDIETIRSLLSK